MLNFGHLLNLLKRRIFKVLALVEKVDRVKVKTTTVVEKEGEEEEDGEGEKEK